MIEFVKTETKSKPREFGTERDVAALIGRSVRTLQKDRCSGRGPFPYYKIAGQVRYDLDEVRRIIRAGLVAFRNSGGPRNGDR